MEIDVTICNNLFNKLYKCTNLMCFWTVFSEHDFKSQIHNPEMLMMLMMLIPDTATNNSQCDLYLLLLMTNKSSSDVKFLKSTDTFLISFRQFLRSSWSFFLPYGHEHFLKSFWCRPTTSSRCPPTSCSCWSPAPSCSSSSLLLLLLAGSGTGFCSFG